MRDLGAEVVGVSADGLDTHRAFAARLKAPFPLASDPDLRVARLYGVADEPARRARRAVFVIDRDGRLLHANPQYSPGNPAHFLAIFKALGVQA